MRDEPKPVFTWADNQAYSSPERFPAFVRRGVHVCGDCGTSCPCPCCHPVEFGEFVMRRMSVPSSTVETE